MNGTMPGQSDLVPWLFVERVALGEDIGLVDFLGPIRRFDLFHRDRHRLLAMMERRRYRFGDLGGQILLMARIRRARASR